MLNLVKVLLFLVTLAYLASWFIPALTFQGGKELIIWPGWVCFFEGILFGIFMHHFEAFSNLLLIPALLFAWFNKWEIAFILTLSSLPIMLQVFFLTYIYQDAVSTASLKGYGPGFYLWVSSFFVMLIISLVMVLQLNRARRKALPEKTTTQQTVDLSRKKIRAFMDIE